MFGAAVSSRLAWKHGPMKKYHLSRRASQKYSTEREEDGNRDSPLDIGPLGEVFLKLGKIYWHFG
jgi:hypothetical protein